MRVTRWGALLAALVLIAGCDRERTVSVLEPPLAPVMSLGTGESWTLTAYYWDDGWVRLAAIDGGFLAADLRIGINAHNWAPDYPAFMAWFDNISAFGDIDLPQGVIEDFDSGIIGPIWNEGGGPCAWWSPAASLCVNPGLGMLVADIPQGPYNGLFRIVGLNTRDLVLHGEFDVQVDFAVVPWFHSLPAGKANIMLCAWDESWVSAICGELDSGFYAMWRGTAGNVPVPEGYDVAQLNTDDVQGKLRITRTRVHKGRVVESVSGTGNYTTLQGDWRTFNFTARRYEDGTVDGQWERIRREDGNAADSKSHGIVTCLTVVGNEAWIGGITTSGLYSTPSTGVAWRVLDTGEGNAAGPDGISTQYTAGMSYPAWYCANTPADPVLNDVEAGNIRISR
jgi:hypothetical protein